MRYSNADECVFEEPFFARETPPPDGGGGGDDDDGGGRGGGGGGGGGEEEFDGDEPFHGETDWWEILRAQRRAQAERLWDDRLAGKRCLSYQTRRASRLVTRYFDRELRCLGVEVRSTQIAVMLALRNAAPRERMADIAKKLWMHPSTLSRAIDALVARGFVMVTPARWDRRVRRGILTPLGLAELRYAHEPWMLAQNIFRIPLRDERAAVQGVRMMAEAGRRRLYAQGLRWEMWVPDNQEPSLM